MNSFKTFRIRIAILAVATLLSATAFAQSPTAKHIVERGETIETIAQKYGVTKEDIVKMNPDAAQFVYVGMELIVPQKEMESQEISHSSQFVQERAIPVRQSYETSSDGASNKPSFGIIAGYSLNNYTGNDIKNTKNKGGFHVGVGVHYGISDYFFAEGMMGIATKGYKQESFDTSGDGWDDEGPNYDITTKTTMKTTNLEVPLYVGVSYSGFFAKAGPYFSYAFNGKMTSDVKDIIYEDIHSSSEGNNTYETKISDMEKYKRFTVGIGAGIGYVYEGFLIQISYQRGLSKLFEKSKIYEQNILFSLGYFF